MTMAVELNNNISSVFGTHVIADIIGDYLSVIDLKACRQVSKEFHVWLSPSFRKNGNFVVNTLQDFQKLHQHPEENYSNRTHKRFVFRFNILDGVRITKSLHNFWLIHSAGMTFMKLENLQQFGGQVMQDILYRQTPNLKTLVIDRCFDNTGEALLEQVRIASEWQQLNLTHLEIGGCFQFMKNPAKHHLLKGFLKLFPNVKILRLRQIFWNYGRCYEAMSQVFDPLVEIRRNFPENYSLKELDLIHLDAYDPKLEIAFLKTLEALNFLKLSTLTLDVGVDTKQNVVTGILNFYKGTLETLELFRPGNAIPYSDFLFGTPMDSLRVLRLSNQVAKTMEFLKFTPKLEVLQISGIAEKSLFLWTDAVCNMSNARKRRSLPKNVIERTNDISMENLNLGNLKQFIFSLPAHTNEMKWKLEKWFPRAKRYWIVAFPK